MNNLPCHPYGVYSNTMSHRCVSYSSVCHSYCCYLRVIKSSPWTCGWINLQWSFLRGNTVWTSVIWKSRLYNSVKPICPYSIYIYIYIYIYYTLGLPTQTEAVMTQQLTGAVLSKVRIIIGKQNFERAKNSVQIAWDIHHTLYSRL